METGTLRDLTTESRNARTMQIDMGSAYEIVQAIHREDCTVTAAVATALPAIAQAAEAAAVAVGKGARLIYCGAGTSGRLGVLDAAECRPTYGVNDATVTALIAGGPSAMFSAVEGAEDSLTLCTEDLCAIHFCADDMLIGIAASGRTPYVIGGLRYAREVIKATTASIACVSDAAISRYADIAIEAVTGPEAVTGSTRMKAGTAQKMILNMISTTAMILLGKVYGNLMVDVQPTNEKLNLRAVRIVMDACGVSQGRAQELLAATGKNVKSAIVMELCGIDADGARVLLERHNGHIGKAVREKHMREGWE